jgi:hypothetical protein
LLPPCGCDTPNQRKVQQVHARLFLQSKTSALGWTRALPMETRRRLLVAGLHNHPCAHAHLDITRTFMQCVHTLISCSHTCGHFHRYKIEGFCLTTGPALAAVTDRV